MNSRLADEHSLPLIDTLIEQVQAGLVDEALTYGSLADVVGRDQHGPSGGPRSAADGDEPPFAADRSMRPLLEVPR